MWTMMLQYTSSECYITCIYFEIEWFCNVYKHLIPGENAVFASVDEKNVFLLSHKQVFKILKRERLERWLS